MNVIAAARHAKTTTRLEKGRGENWNFVSSFI
jgi:hypothetical protein